MSETKPGRYRINLPLLEKLMDKKGLTKAALADRAALDISSVHRLFRGKATYASTLERIATCLGLKLWKELLVDYKPDPIAPPVCVVETVILVSGDLDKWTEDDERNLLEKIIHELKTGQEIKIVKKESGSIKITLRMTQEDADRLAHAIREGKLDDVGAEGPLQTTRIGEFENPSDAITNPEILGPPQAPMPVHWLIRTLRSRRLRTGIGIMSIACGLLGLFPIEAFTWYLVGLVLAGSGAAMNFASITRRRVGFVIPAIGVALNVVAIWAWPNVFGLFDTGNGYSLQYAERMGDVQFVLGDDFPQGEYRIRVSEGGDVPDPAKVRFYGADVQGRTSDTIRVPARQYNVFVYIQKHNIYSMHRVRVRATSQVIELNAGNKITRIE